MADEQPLERVRRLTRFYERVFRDRLFRANTDQERRFAEGGLRTAIGFRKSVERLERGGKT